MVIAFCYLWNLSITTLCWSHRYHPQKRYDGYYKPTHGYNHHVHPKPHPIFDHQKFRPVEKPPITKPEGPISDGGVFRDDVDKLMRKPFYVHKPVTVSTCP